MCGSVRVRVGVRVSASESGRVSESESGRVSECEREREGE